MSAAFTVICTPPLLVARFPGPRQIIGWSINRPGVTVADQVAWLEVRDADLPEGCDPVAILDARLADLGAGGAVGMMTARDVRRHHRAEATVEGVSACCLATAGLSNGGRVGATRTDWHPPKTGTINVLASVSVPLTEGARLEALSIVVEARTVAIIELGLCRPEGRVTGTGTDCVVLAAGMDGDPVPYAGLHTAVGEALGRAVHGAVAEAGRVWLAEQSAAVLAALGLRRG
ncbi:adenosylcobinamide amidohydrolase [Segnochrobactraceae bacterium EtOH-i3]